MDEDDQLRILFAHAFVDALPTDDCPPPDTLLDAVGRALPPEARAAVIDHVAVCAVCAEAWRLARAIVGPEAG
jgi:hypothetical protein